ncbi:hypothetical protein BDV33DRAFT_185456 [Aspergillus novoparasiticus]|uniref:Zn(2)-C6 fungal-type domain-containing protein n=1 Tax=Aspergillus novoparasiticus TaxID=986946 RepID=A0A5N6E716_9EURO|nr:hypothetical protein BDV33DRAFT_185456 [Aspergillus novoparasiticus]
MALLQTSPMTNLTVRPRAILPALSRGPHESPTPNPLSIEGKPKRRSSACTSCQRRRVKCIGPTPCEACVASNPECFFDPSTDKRQRLAQRVAQRDAENYRYISIYLINILRSGKEGELSNLVREMQKASSLDSALADLRLKVSPEKG